MKKLFSLAFLLLFSIAAYAQKDVTRFLGIPVDGTKSEMIRQLKAKGFRSLPYSDDLLEGEFNGRDVHIYVGTNNNRVYRIMVSDANPTDERNIQIRFNNLCSQFENNDKYLSFSGQTIPDDENISYEMTVRKKRYEAVFLQKPIDVTAMAEKLLSILLSKYTKEQLENPTEEIQSDVMDMTIHLCLKKKVWFMINERSYGKYAIVMFYDNEYNQANGEDL